MIVGVVVVYVVVGVMLVVAMMVVVGGDRGREGLVVAVLMNDSMK